MNRQISKGAMVALMVGGTAMTLPLYAETTTTADPKGLMAAQTCAGCHGTKGYIEDSAYVPLAGMPRERFITAMESFADGSRPSTLMGPLARAFTDEEIAAMADYFAAQPKGRAQAIGQAKGQTVEQGED
ncbi:cytochrome C [Guyparkeria halophila]|uniref:Cytochrome C n=1 Tax=Guyparkeria halophila TaxID=47960 RepID=A0ABZ0YVL2_9GAMM|nr:cytochrome C [Guyparkeria halophila]WQH16058.1 cytochrome C [Guyparkeria halophila]